MNTPLLLAKLSLWLGIITLSATITLHLTLGLPPLEAGIQEGFFKKAPGMRPEELVGIWITFSVIFYAVLTGLVLERFTRKEPSPIFAGSIGVAAIACAITINTVVPGHMAFNLLIVPGLLILSGTALEHFFRK